MCEYFKLISTYDVVLEFSTNTRPVRIEIFQSTEASKKLRARVWDQHTYNLHPTFINAPETGGIENRVFSCDEVNREITNFLSDDPSNLIFGKEWESEQEFLSYLKGLIKRHHEALS